MLAFLARSKPAPTPETAPPAQDADHVAMRFRTHGGAEVHVNRRGLVTCLGCDYTHNWTSIIYGRDDANEHAAGCRSMPKPTPA